MRILQLDKVSRDSAGNVVTSYGLDGPGAAAE